MSLRRRTVLALLMAAGLARAARAQTGMPAPAVRRLVPELPVRGYRDGNGELQGLVGDQARAILQRASLDATIEMLPVVRLYAELARPWPEGKSYGMVGLPIREPYTTIVPLALTMRSHLVAVGRQGLALRTAEDLRQIGPVAVTATGTAALTAAIQQYRLAVQEGPSTLNGLRMMARGRVDAVLGIDTVIDQVARTNGLAGDLGDRVSLATMEAWLACDPASVDAAETAPLRTAAEALYREGRLQAIAEQHYQKNATGF
jgi:ABC-type amino acid transport substrate-binding protein